MSDRRLANSQLGSLEYDPAPESASIAKLKPSYGLFIDGKFTDAESDARFATVNPATEESLSSVAQASAADVDRAVAFARHAYEKVWSKTWSIPRYIRLMLKPVPLVMPFGEPFGRTPPIF